MCFAWISEQTAIFFSPHSNNLSVFITEAECVYCAVRTGSFKLDRYSFVLKGLIFNKYLFSHPQFLRGDMSTRGDVIYKRFYVYRHVLLIVTKNLRFKYRQTQLMYEYIIYIIVAKCFDLIRSFSGH